LRAMKKCANFHACIQLILNIFMLIALKVSLNDALEACLVRKMQLLSLETEHEIECISRFFNTNDDLISRSKAGDQNAGENLKIYFN